MSFTLDYNRWIHFDAENLAEQGIGEAYERVKPELRNYGVSPALVEEMIDNDLPSYSVRFGNTEYVIHHPNSSEWAELQQLGRSRPLCSFVSSMTSSPIRVTSFYAINVCGNDLRGQCF